MHYIDKSSRGQARNRGDQRYLRSDVSLHDGTKSQFWPYAHFEKIVLNHLKQLDWATLVRQGPDDECDKLDAQIAETEMHTAKLQADIGKFLDNMADMPDPLLKAAKVKAAAAAQELEDTEAKLNDLYEQRDHMAAARNSVAEGIVEFKALISEGDPKNRLALQMEIRRRVRSITAFRFGHAPEFKGTEVENLPANDWPYVVIEYRNGMKQRLMSSPVRNPPTSAPKKSG